MATRFLFQLKDPRPIYSTGFLPYCGLLYVICTGQGEKES